MTPAGLFRDRVYLQAATPIVDTDTGEEPQREWQVRDWDTLVPAYIRELNSREAIRARAAELQTTHVITIRYRRYVNHTLRVLWNDAIRGLNTPPDTPGSGGPWRVAKIIGITETVRRREMELQCVEIIGPNEIAANG